MDFKADIIIIVTIVISEVLKMVIEHNIPGLNANRNRTKNSSKLAKSLEKLSTGYAINRAADNAAGLAVSEKMRSQIGGMKQAIKNCRDGVSLIQTFEGALDETVAIIKRAKTLADQAANGTYDDSIDRSAIEIEYLHLCDEIDHIAGTDFNGIVMLSWQPDSAARAEARINSALNDMPDIHTQQADTAVMSLPEVSHTAATKKAMAVFSKAAVFAAPRAAGTVCGDFTVYGDPGDFSFDTGTGVLTILGGDVTVTGKSTKNTIVVAKDKSANVTLINVNIDVSGTDNACAFKIEDDSKGDVVVTIARNNTLKSGANCAGLQKNGETTSGFLTINGSGSLNAFGGDGIGYYPGGGAGIGSAFGYTAANITINSGTILAYGGFDGAGIGGGGGDGTSTTYYSNTGAGKNITINGGTITALSIGGAGIGGGNRGEGIGININGGSVTAHGGDFGAGIGGGVYASGRNITISGGTVNAYSGCSGGAGIGGGHYGGDGDGIIISGGTIYAESKDFGAGIGGGDGGNGIGIVISGGTVTALGNTAYTNNGSVSGAGIGAGGGHNANSKYPEEIGGKGEVTIKNKDTVVIAKGGEGAENIGCGTNAKETSTINIDPILTQES